MLNSTILNKKPDTAGIDNGNILKDLSYQTLPINFYNQEFEFDIILVDKSFEFRPIFIVETTYNNKNYWDLFLKINRISNPFDIQEGDILITPPFSFFDNLNLSSANNFENVFQNTVKELNKERAGKTDPRRKNKNRPNKNQDEDSSPDDDSLNVGDESIKVDSGLEQNIDNISTALRNKVLKKALKQAQESGNDVLANQINQAIQCN